MNLNEIIKKRKSFNAGSRVTNCIQHMNLKFDQRPKDCHLCHTDMGNFINYVLHVNTFTNELLDEIEKIVAKDIQQSQMESEENSA